MSAASVLPSYADVGLMLNFPLGKSSKGETSSYSLNMTSGERGNYGRNFSFGKSNYIGVPLFSGNKTGSIDSIIYNVSMTGGEKVVGILFGVGVAVAVGALYINATKDDDKSDDVVPATVVKVDPVEVDPVGGEGEIIFG